MWRARVNRVEPRTVNVQCGAPLLSEVDPLQEGLDPHPNLRGTVVIATD